MIEMVKGLKDDQRNNSCNTEPCRPLRTLTYILREDTMPLESFTQTDRSL